MFALARKFAGISHVHIKWTLLLLIGLIATVQLLHDPNASNNYASYDQMLKQRLWTPPLDPKIVVVDIDEASLSKLNAEFGRWPWPRETLASALEWLESKGTNAVVFDILFSDLDATHPNSDQAFADAVSQSKNSFFPILRLNPINDGISQIRADQLTGFAQTLNDKAPVPTLAVIPPVFDAVVKTQRMGYHNIYPDKDGINRHYDLWQDTDQWRLLSLPARMGQSFGWNLGEDARVLINFNSATNNYVTVPFHEIWQLSQSRAGRNPDPRFDGAIVLIGSTASSLFDVKATPMTPIHPGVYVLANTIDNLKNTNFLHELPFQIKLFTVWFCLLLMGLASTRMKTQVLRWSVLVIPTLLLGVSFMSLHIGHWFIDLSGSASHALLFFSVMNVYQNWRLNHFADCAGMVKSLTDKNSTPLFKSFVVTSYAPENLKPQRLITHAAACGSSVGVVQAGWYGELVGEQSGPSCVLLINESQAKLTNSMQKLINDESAFAAQCYQSPISEIQLTSEFLDSKESQQQLWNAVAKALTQWENYQK